MSKNNTNASTPRLVDVTATEEHGADLPGSQGKKGNRMYHTLIFIKEVKAN